MTIAGGSIMIIGTIILGSSYSTAQFLVGRIVTGFGNGINSSTVPTYQSEMARPEVRGRLLSAQGTVTIVGLCIAYFLDYGLSFVDSGAQWRFPISFQAFFAVCLVLQMIPLPDTPRWLCEQDRGDEAAEILARLQLTQPADESTPEVVLLRRQIETAIEMESKGGPFRYRELLTGGKLQNLRRMILAGLVNVQQQFTGQYCPCMNKKKQYLTPFRLKYDKLLRPCGVRIDDAPFSQPVPDSGWLHLTNVPSWVNNPLVEHGQVRPTIIVDVLRCRTLSVLCNGSDSPFDWYYFLCICRYCIRFSLPSLPRHWISTSSMVISTTLHALILVMPLLKTHRFYPSEITTTRIRARGQAFAGFVNWMCVCEFTL